MCGRIFVVNGFDARNTDQLQKLSSQKATKTDLSLTPKASEEIPFLLSATRNRSLQYGAASTASRHTPSARPELDLQ